jgi:hypothetical protein
MREVPEQLKPWCIDTSVGTRPTQNNQRKKINQGVERQSKAA